MSENMKLIIENKLTLIISLAQLSVLLFLTHQVNSMQLSSSSESLIVETNSESSDVINKPLSDFKRLAEMLALELASNDQYSRNIASAIQMEFKEVLEKSNTTSADKSEHQRHQNINTISLDELKQRTEIFIGSSDISIDSINLLYQQIGPLNNEQRKYVRRAIATAINSGQASLIQ
ncbi:MAG: hypothetical protein KUG78_02750 [Kangiellaceae bacterium]|nr:hypothetical protein [Kangiellaceae bacterium]